MTIAEVGEWTHQVAEFNCISLDGIYFTWIRLATFNADHIDDDRSSHRDHKIGRVYLLSLVTRVMKDNHLFVMMIRTIPSRGIFRQSISKQRAHRFSLSTPVRSARSHSTSSSHSSGSEKTKGQGKELNSPLAPARTEHSKDGAAGYVLYV